MTKLLLRKQNLLFAVDRVTDAQWPERCRLVIGGTEQPLFHPDTDAELQVLTGRVDKLAISVPLEYVIPGRSRHQSNKLAVEGGDPLLDLTLTYRGLSYWHGEQSGFCKYIAQVAFNKRPSGVYAGPRNVLLCTESLEYYFGRVPKFFKAFVFRQKSC